MTSGRLACARQRAIPAFLCATILLGLLSPVTSYAGSATSLQWWPLGQTQVGQGFHIRIPVTVRNTHEYPFDNGLVVAEVDIAKKLIEVGWVKQPRAGTDLLRSFELDEASVRVVGMTNLEPASPGSTSGLLKAYDTSRRTQDPSRYEVPSRHFAGFLAGSSQVAYDAATNPAITVMWRVEGRLEPGEERHFVIYFDSLTNRQHEPGDPAALRGGGLLDRAFWNGPGTDLLGFVSPSASQRGLVTAIGLHDDTRVNVLVANAAGTFEPQPLTGLHPNPFTIGKNEFRDVFIGNAQGTAFRLVASKPILALVDSEGFIPTPTGEVVGNEFLFATNYGADDGQDSLFFYNRHPGLAPTIVRLHSLKDGKTTDIHLSDPQNQFPYTLGAHALELETEGSTCTFPPPDEAAIIETGRNQYRAVVISGGPVALQLQPITGITQIPSTDDAPYGTAFWTALSRSTGVRQGGTCLRNVQQYATYATSATAARLELTTPEAPTRIFPPCQGTSCPPGEIVGPAPLTTMGGRTFDTEDFSDRPLRFQTDSPAWLMISPTAAPSLASAALRGPLGGAQGARVFAGIGPTLVYAPYNDTVVQGRIDYALSGVVDIELLLAKERLTPLPERAGNNRILWYTLEANRPLLVLPRGAAPGFLAGIPPLLHATIHEADYRGHLVEIRSATGLDPATSSTVPGGTASYTFLVTNRGRAAGATDLPDTIEISHSPPPRGWSATLSRTALRLATGETQEVQLFVTAPVGAPPGALAALTVRAQSRSMPLVADTADAVTFIKRSFNVGLWFDHVDGPKAVTDITSASDPVDYQLVLQNRGTVRDRISVSFSPPDGEWDVILLRDGAEVVEVELEPLETDSFTLRVRPPSSAAEGVLLTSVEARSLSTPAILDRVAATTKLRAPSLLVLTIDNDTVWVSTGNEALFNLTLRNEGQGTTEVSLELQHERLPSWTEPRIFLRTSPGNARAYLDRVSLGPGDVLPLSIATTVSSDAAAAERTSIRFSATSSNGASSLEDFLTAIVLPHHDLAIEAPIGPIRFERGGTNLTMEVRIENRGNLHERLRLNPASVPAGWVLRPAASEVLVPRNRTQVVSVHIMTPSSAGEGDYQLAMDIISFDGNRTRIPFVGRMGGFTMDAVDGVRRSAAQPGRTAQASFSFENLGNVPLDVRVQQAPGEVWELAGKKDATSVPPGAEVSVTVAWRVPPEAASGTSRHRALLVARPTSAGVAAFERTLEADIDVGRADLRIVEVKSFLGAAGSVIFALVANEGQRAAYNAELVLRVGDVVIDRVVMGEVPPGSQQNATLLRPDGATGQATIVADPSNAVPESDESNNAFAVDDLQKSERATPGLRLGALVAVLAVLVLRRRRAQLA